MGECPVKHGSTDASKGSASSSTVFSNQAPGTNGTAPGCSYANGMGPVAQEPHPHQTRPLETKRVTSTIPKSGGEASWEYPSPQMFYNALKRKGYAAQEGDMSTVVAIHNSVNERSWHEVLRWEARHAAVCPTPVLKRFQGRPTDYSLRARFNQLRGYTLPFDRHDWVVDRCGTEVRYILDYYEGTPDPNAPQGASSIYLDVRPALDSTSAAMDRLKVFFGWD